MYEFKDPAGRGRAATIAVMIWLALDVAFTLSCLMTISALGGLGEASPSVELADQVAVVTGLALLVTNITTIVLVARWIMRVNANAHSLSDDMTITPGWAVGWFFIPIATYWKPFQAMRETWQASVAPHDPLSVQLPAVMRWWWGLWIVTMILGNLSFRLSMSATTAEALIAASWIDVATFGLDVPLAFSLITMISRLNELQARGPDYAETFA